MARLIDAEKLDEDLCEILRKAEYDHNCDAFYRFVSEMNDCIDEQPTVDAVEVVMALWKKTAEEKPDSSRHLIVTDGGLISHYGYYVKPKDKWFKTWKCEEEIPEPSFWMDMPEPPAESILSECGC